MFRFLKRAQDNNSAYVPEDFAVKKSRRAKVFLFSCLLATLLVFITAGWIVLRSPFLRVKEIEIAGNNSVPKENILGLALSGAVGGSYLKALLGTDHYFNWGGDMLAGKIRLIPAIKSAEVAKNFVTGKVVIKIEEREPYGIWCLWPQTGADLTQTNAENNNQRQSAPSQRDSASTKCYWFDNGGTIFKNAVSAQGSLITSVDDYSQNGLGLLSKILPERMIVNAFSVFGALKRSGLAIKEIKLNDLELEELEVSMHDGPKLHFSLRFPADSAAAALAGLMSKSGFKDLKYADFRVENRIYYR